jgi:REP element-mobilizing transposase RayT
MRDFDQNDFPLAYLITFRCYGTWLHGDERGAYRRTHGIVSGVSWIEPRPRLERAEARQLKHEPVTLDASQRAVVDKAVREVCVRRKYSLCAINVRTNHVHTVVSAQSAPEPVLNAFKSYATRALRLSKSFPANIMPWARHGSTIYLWKERDVSRAVEYVVVGQDHGFETQWSPPSRSG